MGLEEVNKCIREGLPTPFTNAILERILEKLQGSYIEVGEGDRDGWKGASAKLHTKEPPKDDSLAQTANAKWLNGLLEQIVEIVKEEFPDNLELQNICLLHKWVSLPNTLVDSLHKPNLLLVLIDLAEKSVHFKDIVTSCEVKYANTPVHHRSASAQASEIALFCMWKQVNHCYYVAFSLCGNRLTILQYTRGGPQESLPIDIEIHCELFIQLLLMTSLGGSESLLWLGYDAAITNNHSHKQVTLCNPVKTIFTLIHLIFMAYSLKGRGIHIWLVRDQNSCYLILKDFWLPQGWANDIVHHWLLQDKSRNNTQFAVDVRSNEDEVIFSDQDIYHIFNEPLFNEPNSPGGLKGIPTLLYWDEVQCRNVPETTWMLLGLPPNFSKEDHENCLHSRATFFECRIGISWFSCAREFFNAMMGALVGHFNGYTRRKMLQCDISNTNVWMQIPEPEPEFVVPDWPKDKGPHWYPKWTGLLSDWGYAADVRGKLSRRDNSCFIMGTFPFQVQQIMSWDAGLGWAGEFTWHTVQHDLESFVWLMWVLCINLDGPFNRRQFGCKDFEKLDHQSSTTKHIKLEDIKADANVSSSKSSRKNKMTPPAPTVKSLVTDIPPMWAQSGLHTTHISDVMWSKSMVFREGVRFPDYLSPYFSKHMSVKSGFEKLAALFVWNPSGERDINSKVQYLAPKPTMYKGVINIIKEMRDGIEPKMDGAPSKEEIEDAQKEFMGLLKRGNLETPLVGNRAGPSSQSKTQSKKRSLDD
ncbi:hypothetical protein SCLCIDRAFT_31353 [Scleroderma citrinum Foug A]|uniref:Fungal-type protein kinase domain-containing protein n=1 Tax=Scleroderma citrinum Foug A TaxID=1036808 RepID=A0A0C3CZZ3_9AGAM|nr:hypothetical protein SCLCIDRAFT_31353 [Scleroderma citrinum Foug A]